MKTIELRKGNLINTEEFHIKKFQGVHQFELSWYKYIHMFKPIELTEEWLIKFEFKKIFVEGLQICIGNEQFLSFENNIMYIYSMDCPNKHYAVEIECKYVHQLQNLYFALTGRELNFRKKA